MAQVNFPFSDLEELVSISKEDAIETLTMLGFPTEETGDGGLTVEVTPNRPDALCVEGIARALRCRLEGKPVAYQVRPARVSASVDASVAGVRPFFGCAVVRGLKITDSFLRSIVSVQEKLHETLGRKRRKVAIGIHDLDKVSPPFRYFACRRDAVSFVPLDMRERMTPERILAEHPKGIAYAHLVGELCPMIEDHDKRVLSFPPVINGELTRMSESTKNAFIDVTGTSGEAVRQSVNILVSMLAGRGGQAEEVLVNGKPYRLLQESRWPLPVQGAERVLGVKFSAQEIGALLSKMGYRTGDNAAYAPGYRADVISEIDLIEDVAIAYGFNNFEPRLPDFASVGNAVPEPALHEVLAGLGFDEAVTWKLSNPQLAKKAGLENSGAIEIENPLTKDATMFRVSLLPNLLSVLSDSKNEKLPIKIYEAGTVGAPRLGKRCAIASMHPKASFSEIKGVVLSLAESLGKCVEVKKASFGHFAEGRCAEIFVDGNPVGHMGEIAPQVLSDFNLEQPVCAAEMEQF